MIYALTLLWCLPSPVIWLFNAEAWVVGWAVKGVDFPFVLALCAAISQVVTFTGFFFFGEVILRRLPRVSARLQKLDAARYRGAGYTVLGLASLLGLPPLVLLALIARTLRYRFAIFLALCFAGRLGRFVILAYAPDTFRSLFGATTGT
jgi:membrane protein YqaA with SNARE-associated domain